MSLCPVCTDSLDSARSFRVKRYEYVRCGRCGHLTRRGEPVAQFSLPAEVKYLRWPWVRRMLENYDRGRVRQYRNVFGRYESPHVLDVGAGPMLTARTLGEMGIGYTGVEPNPRWQEFVPPSDVEVIRGTLAEVPGECFGRANVVFLFHVVEHFPDPVGELSRLVDRCGEGTSIVARTPDAGSLGFRLWRRLWYPLCPDEHPGLFSKESLMLALLRSGPVEVQRCASSGFYGDTFLSCGWTMKRLLRIEWLSIGLTALLSPLFIAADVLVGSLARLLGRSGEVDLVCQKRDDDFVFASFVIPAYNESTRIGRALDAIHRAIAAAPLPPERFEILVVDNASEDNTAEIAKSKGARVVPLQDRHISKARNFGGRNARGQYLVFVDADVEVDEGFVVELIRGAARYQIDTAGARLHINDDGGASASRLGNVMMGILRDWFGASFSLFIMRREVFERHGGFDERVYAYEDVHWLIKVKCLGYIGKCRRYRVLRRCRASVSSRAARRRGTGVSYLKHALFPWLRYSKKHCEYWYANRPSD